jgi:hypothetical protein
LTQSNDLGGIIENIRGPLGILGRQDPRFEEAEEFVDLAWQGPPLLAVWNLACN